MRKLSFAIAVLMFVASLSTPCHALNPVKVDIKVTINKPPSVTNIAPIDGSVVNDGDTLVVTITASDPNQDSLSYRFFINGAVKQDWQSGSSWSYQFGSGDIGLNKVKAEVTDGMRTTTSDEVEVYVFRGAVNLPQ